MKALEPTIQNLRRINRKLLDDGQFYLTEACKILTEIDNSDQTINQTTQEAPTKDVLTDIMDNCYCVITKRSQNGKPNQLQGCRCTGEIRTPNNTPNNTPNDEFNQWNKNKQSNYVPCPAYDTRHSRQGSYQSWNQRNNSQQICDNFRSNEVEDASGYGNINYAGKIQPVPRRPRTDSNLNRSKLSTPSKIYASSTPKKVLVSNKKYDFRNQPNIGPVPSCRKCYCNNETDFREPVSRERVLCPIYEEESNLRTPQEKGSRNSCCYCPTPKPRPAPIQACYSPKPLKCECRDDYQRRRRSGSMEKTSYDMMSTIANIADSPHYIKSKHTHSSVHTSLVNNLSGDEDGNESDEMHESSDTPIEFGIINNDTNEDPYDDIRISRYEGEDSIRAEPGDISDIRDFRDKHYFECHSSKTILNQPQSVLKDGNHKCKFVYKLNKRLFPEPVYQDANCICRCPHCHLPLDVVDGKNTSHNHQESPITSQSHKNRSSYTRVRESINVNNMQRPESYNNSRYENNGNHYHDSPNVSNIAHRDSPIVSSAQHRESSNVYNTYIVDTPVLNNQEYDSFVINPVHQHRESTNNDQHRKSTRVVQETREYSKLIQNEPKEPISSDSTPSCCDCFRNEETKRKTNLEDAHSSGSYPQVYVKFPITKHTIIRQHKSRKKNEKKCCPCKKDGPVSYKPVEIDFEFMNKHRAPLDSLALKYQRHQ